MRVRHCPMCASSQRTTAPACSCGFVFDVEHALATLSMGVVQPTADDQRRYHRHRVVIGWLTIVACALLVLCCTAATHWSYLLMPVWASVMLLLRGVQTIYTARTALRAIDEAHPKLPKARLLT